MLPVGPPVSLSETDYHVGTNCASFAPSLSIGYVSQLPTPSAAFSSILKANTLLSAITDSAEFKNDSKRVFLCHELCIGLWVTAKDLVILLKVQHQASSPIIQRFLDNLLIISQFYDPNS